MRNLTGPATAGGRVLELAVREMVDRPDEVEVREIHGAQAVVLEVAVAREDYPRVVGRKGRTADALRELLMNIGSREHRRYVLSLIDPHFMAEPSTPDVAILARRKSLA